MTTNTMNLVDLANTTWNLDPAHTTVGFSVRHAMISTVRGSFRDFTGTIIVTGPTTATVAATIKPASVDTGNDQRDEHLRSAEFFDTDTAHDWQFNSVGVRDIDGNEFVLDSQLTINGVTKPVTLDVEFLGTNTDAFGTHRAGFAATGTIKRSDFNITWNAALEAGGVLVSDSVKLELDISAVAA